MPEPELELDDPSLTPFTPKVSPSAPVKSSTLESLVVSGASPPDPEPPEPLDETCAGADPESERERRVGKKSKLEQNNFYNESF